MANRKMEAMEEKFEGEIEGLKGEMGSLKEGFENLKIGIEERISSLEALIKRSFEAHGKAIPSETRAPSVGHNPHLGLQREFQEEEIFGSHEEPLFGESSRRRREETRRGRGRQGEEDRRTEWGDREEWRYRPCQYQGGGRPYYGGGDPRMRKLKMPIFEGEDAHGWLYRVERYFSVNGLNEEEKLTSAALCLEGKALSWYRWRDQRYPIRSWGEFKDCLLERFQNSREGDFYEQFLALAQEGTVMEYRERFEHLSSRLSRPTESVLEGNFMKGLNPDIRSAVRLQRPRDLGEAMELAQLVEDQHSGERHHRSTHSETYRTITTSIPTREEDPSFTKDVPKGTGYGGKLEGTFKRLTETELQDKRAKGLCFRCDERFTPGHRCKDRTLQVLTVCDEVGEEVAVTDEEDEGHVHQEVAEDGGKENVMHHWDPGGK